MVGRAIGSSGARRTGKAGGRHINRRRRSLATERTLLNLATSCTVGERGRLGRGISVRVVAMTVVMLGDMLLLGLLSLLPALLNHLDVVVEDGGDDGNHVCLDHARANSFGATNSYVDDALEGEVPLPHVHHVLAPSLLQNADEALDASIDGQNVSDSSRGCRKICEVV